ncbi:MAG: anhydro-N-acetylmuramic acid kinase [Bacteroidetes bacterium]|nr:anhydro-N-acetylmuramic acid kinase [Bacteroidota bacterium]
MKNKFHVIGAMSGTSLDGLDLAYCIFEKKKKGWNYSIQQTQCIKYSTPFRNSLAALETKSALEFVKADTEFGLFTGNKIKSFIAKHGLTVDFIASHGHTIFHQPQNGFTSQIGNGAAIAAATGLTTICDFRRLDVALGGQGAPLVPIGDQLLFGEYDYCLNLGGFANISFQQKRNRIAFDICPVNIVLNSLSLELGKNFDKNGSVAKSGKLNKDLLNELNALSFYAKQFPKSLGKEWVLDEIFPLLHRSKLPIADKLNTFCEHIAIQVSKAIKSNAGKIICTGGGTYNRYLIQRIQHHTHATVVVPEKKLIEFKEALLFAFLGVLRSTGEKNCLKSVTGAIADNIGGCIYVC